MAPANYSRLNKLLMSFALLVAAGTGLPAHATTGGVAGGGGNTLHGRLIETYGGHSVHELKGYDAAIARLTALVPTFAMEQAQLMSLKAIYLIPESFGELPLRATELDFQTDLPCYQTQDEIFCNPDKLKAMTASEQTDLFIHEAVMSARLAAGDNGPSIGDLRVVVGTLIRANVTDIEASNILNARNFKYYVPARIYQKAQRNRAAIEKSDFALCRRNGNEWDSTNDGNPFYHLQTVLETKYGIEFGAAMDIRQSWTAEDVRRYGSLKADANDSGLLEQMKFCDALFRKYHLR